MKRTILPLAVALMATFSAHATDVDTVRMAAPVRVKAPVILDSVDAAQKKFNLETLLGGALPRNIAQQGDLVALSSLAAGSAADGYEVKTASFQFAVKGFANIEVRVAGPQYSKVFVEGKEVSRKNPYQPGIYTVVVRYLSDTAALKLSLDADKSDNVSIPSLKSQDEGGRHPFTLTDNMLMRHYTGVNVSPSGKYAIVSTSWFDEKGTSHWRSRVMEVATGRVVTTATSGLRWMPKSDRVLTVRTDMQAKQLVAINPVDLSEQVLCENLPSYSYVMSPSEDYLIITEEVEGPKHEDGVYEIISPEDRQPGWRNRSNITRLDLATGTVQPLTFGYHSLYLRDIADDGSRLLFSVSEDSLTQRPTSRTTLYELDMATLQTRVLISKDGFVSDIEYLPGTDIIAVTGSAEAFNGIGRNLPDNMTPNEFEHQLFLLDRNTLKVNAVTRDFNPSVASVVGMVNPQTLLFRADNQDSVGLYRLDLKNFAISQVAQPLEVVQNASLSRNGGMLLFYGCGACVPEKLYSMNMTAKKNQLTMMEDLNADRMAHIELGTCDGYKMQSSRGYEITGHYYLPAHFDANKKYPMIVHYYGGCSPTARRFGGGSHYPAHYWNAMGYVVLVVNPSGAAGFGQEWGARHVNTMGEGVAEDIIEYTQQFCKDHPYVNAEKVGCVSASYGGFMTQLLLTKTDFFATGISHAGISDHTSYWGEGYWGYSYSEVSAANSYPWTRKDLYVDRSPLYNADKIHKPLLFTHGTADTNVPIGESIQMYTALKLLGVPTSFIMVEGENHGIMDFTKRQKWINSMMAWFQMYLQDDPSWWNAMYESKSL